VSGKSGRNDFRYQLFQFSAENYLNYLLIALAKIQMQRAGKY